MKREYNKKKLVAEINITPFTDVILVLLVIFMITTPLMYQANIEVKLPQAKVGKPAEGTGQREAYITVDKQGLVYLNGKVITRKELKEKIKTLHKDNPGLSVILRSDKATKFQDIVYVLDMLTELGVAKLNIAVAEEGQ